jgi:hypothetical protein
VRVNGIPRREAVLAAGDEVRLGDTVLRFTPSPPAAAATVRLDVRDRSDTVEVSLPHTEADLLGGSSAPLSPAEVKREHTILRQICEVTHMAATGRDAEAAVGTILDRLHDALDADTACILTAAGGEDWAIRAASARTAQSGRATVSRTIARQAITRGVSILSADPLHDGRFGPSQSIVAGGLTSAICSPLKVGDAFVGVLVLDRRGRRESFQPMDLRFAATLANLIALLLEREQWHATALQKERLAVIGEVMAGLAHGQGIPDVLLYERLLGHRTRARGGEEDHGGARRDRVCRLARERIHRVLPRPPLPRRILTQVPTRAGHRPRA